MTAGAARATGRRWRDRAGRAAVTAALALFAWLTLLAAGLPTGFMLSHPVGVAGIALAAGLLGLTRLRVVVWGAALLLAAVVAVVTLTPILAAPARALARTDAWPAERVDAVVVLSAWITEEGLLTPTGMDRLLAGVALARERGVGQLVTSRVTRRAGGRDLTSDAEQRRLATLGAPPLALAIVAPVASTRDEAVLVLRLAAERGWSRVAVVTSPSHSRRACATFERVGLAVTCVAAPSRLAPADEPRGVVGRLRWAVDVLYETAATALYRQRGWIG